MLTAFLRLFQTPNLADPEKNLRARSLHTILLGTLVLSGLFLVYSLFNPPYSQVFVAVLALAVVFILLGLLRSERVGLASGTLVLVLWTAIFYEVALYGGIRDTGFSAFLAIILIAGLTMGIRSALVVTILTLFGALGLGVAEMQGLLPAYQQVPLVSVFLSHSTTLLAVLALINLTIRNISQIAWKAMDGEARQKEINAQLEQNRAELGQQAVVLESRNRVLMVLAEMPRIASRTTEEPVFLERTLEYLSRELKPGYLVLHMLEETGSAAVHFMAFGPEGARLPSIEDDLPVVKSEFATGSLGSNTLRFSLATGTYLVENPGLRSGMHTGLSVPLVHTGLLLGLLTLQSADEQLPPTLQGELQSIADQLVLSLHSLRLLNRLEAKIAEADQLAGMRTQRSWESYLHGPGLGFQYDRLNLVPAGEALPEQAQRAILEGKSATFRTTGSPVRARLVAPIVLREEVIGVLGYDHGDAQHVWQADEISLLESIASRVSLALENTRLFSEAQKRAERERLISQVSTDIRATLDMQTILQTAVRQIKKRLDVGEAEVQLLPPGGAPVSQKLDDKATE